MPPQNIYHKKCLLYKSLKLIFKDLTLCFPYIFEVGEAGHKTHIAARSPEEERNVVKMKA